MSACRIRGPVILAICLSWAAGAQGQTPDEPEDASAEEATPEETPSPESEARRAFVEGTEHVRNARWAEALAAYEKAAKIRPHPVTTYNIGACERALGMYTRARQTFRRALAEHEASTKDRLPDTLVERAKGFLKQLDTLLVMLTLEVIPNGATIAVDGRPLDKTDERVGALPVTMLSDRAGDPRPVPAPRFVIQLDPGARLITLSRPGFATAVVNRTFPPGTKPMLKLQLDKLPATLTIHSSPGEGIASVNQKDVGPTPIDVRRPAGQYEILVEKDGYLPYQASLSVEPGQQLDVHANLVKDDPTIFERWWFWTIAGAAVAGAVVGTYFAVRSTPDPVREEVSGGSFGYKVRIP